MSACKSHQRQIALLAVEALDESQRPAVLDHLNHCPTCRAYWNQLQSVVGLYTQDAERSVRPTIPLSIRRLKPKDAHWIALPKLAMLAAAVLVFCGTLLLLRDGPDDNPPQPVPTAKTASLTHSGTLSIATARDLARKDLDEIMNSGTPAGQHRADFVYSVGTRHEDP